MSFFETPGGEPQTPDDDEYVEYDEVSNTLYLGEPPTDDQRALDRARAAAEAEALQIDDFDELCRQRDELIGPELLGKYTTGEITIEQLTDQLTPRAYGYVRAVAHVIMMAEIEAEDDQNHL